jgi:transketolase
MTRYAADRPDSPERLVKTKDACGPEEHEMEPTSLKETAKRIRLRDLEMVYRAGAGHIGGEMSAIDILTTLYFQVLRVDPARPDDPDRDRFVLSKGHSAAALYATLAERGFMPIEQLESFLQPYSALNGHPNRVKVSGIETNTGPLGHGLPVSVGMARAAKLKGSDWRVFVLTGDGELQEGSNWEAAMAAAQFGLDNLTLIVDHNRLQQGATLEETNQVAPIADKFAAFGWVTTEIDGHDIGAITEALDRTAVVAGRPKCVVAHTHKGRGVSFMEDRVEWHHKVPSEEQYIQAKHEIESAVR